MGLLSCSIDQQVDVTTAATLQCGGPRTIKKVHLERGHGRFWPAAGEPAPPEDAQSRQGRRTCKGGVHTYLGRYLGRTVGGRSRGWEMVDLACMHMCCISPVGCFCLAQDFRCIVVGEAAAVLHRSCTGTRDPLAVGDWNWTWTVLHQHFVWGPGEEFITTCQRVRSNAEEVWGEHPQSSEVESRCPGSHAAASLRNPLVLVVGSVRNLHTQ